MAIGELMESQAPWLIAAVLSALTAVAGWLARGRQRIISQEDGALGLYRDALALLESAQDALSAMGLRLDEVQSLLNECVRARDQSKIERAQDRVKIAQLEEEIVRLRVHVNATEARAAVGEVGP